MCKESEKTIDHLLLQCEVAKTLWASIYGFDLPSFLFRIAIPQRVVELFASWRSQFESHRNL
jgi:hypothetical protein